MSDHKERGGKGAGHETAAGREEALAAETLVPVSEVPDESTATMLCDFLRAQGVEATAVAMQIPWFGTIETARQGFWGRVEVLESHAKRAEQLIRDFYAAKPEPDSSTPSEEEGKA
jgi:hypothetical protein